MSDFEKMLERVYERGDTLRRRRRVGGGLTVIIAVAIFASVPTALIGGDERQVHVGDDGSSSTTERSSIAPTVTSLAAGEGSDVSAPPTTGQPAATDSTAAGPEAEPEATSTTYPCRNSFDQSCGPFVWDPDPPPSQPISFAATWSPDTPPVGQEVTFTITLTDPDAVVSTECYEVQFGDGAVATDTSDCSPPPCPEAFGPHDPPPPEPSAVTLTFTHTYETAGPHTLVVNAASGLDVCHTPYANWGTQSFKVVVS